MVFITCKELSCGYDGRAVIKNLNFEVCKGDYLCILGENGAGKSTLMKTLLQLQKPVGGSLLVGDGLKKNEIGYLPQRTTTQMDFPASVYEIVLSGLGAKMGLRPFYNLEEKIRAHKAMEKMQIMGLCSKSFSKLSGGQQQRVLLARALCATSKILLLDEPVAGLDPETTKSMYETIKQLNAEGITIIMISHDREGALKYATHILYLGEKVFYGKKEDFNYE